MVGSRHSPRAADRFWTPSCRSPGWRWSLWASTSSSRVFWQARRALAAPSLRRCALCASPLHCGSSRTCAKQTCGRLAAAGEPNSGQIFFCRSAAPDSARIRPLVAFAYLRVLKKLSQTQATALTFSPLCARTYAAALGCRGRDPARSARGKSPGAVGVPTDRQCGRLHCAL